MTGCSRAGSRRTSRCEVSKGALNTEGLSPAERYAAARARQTSTAATPRLEEFRERIEFPLDDFQLAACSVLEAGHSVLVAAPTGAGKTIVAEFAVHLALAQPRDK